MVLDPQPLRLDEFRFRSGGRAHRPYGLFAIAAPAAGIAVLCLVAATLTIFSRQQDEETTTSLQGSDKDETGAASD
jgi:hypothetical protein